MKSTRITREEAREEYEVLKRRHLRFGWWSLLLFLCMGLVLEALHGLKLGWYLDVTSDARRLLLRLAHAHGALLALVNLAFAGTLGLLGQAQQRPPRFGSSCLLIAGCLLPAGFCLGGLAMRGPDPGLGIFFVPLGAGVFFAGVLAIAVAVARD